jgi:hypothetical protein
VADVDEAPESRQAPGLPDGGCGGGGLLTSAGLAGLVLLAHFPHAVLDDCAGDKVFEHFGLLVWDRAADLDESILCLNRAFFCPRADTPSDRFPTSPCLRTRSSAAAPLQGGQVQNLDP